MPPLVKCLHCPQVGRTVEPFFVCASCRANGAVPFAGDVILPNLYYFEVELRCDNCGQGFAKWIHGFESSTRHPMRIQPCEYCGTAVFTGSWFIRGVDHRDKRNVEHRQIVSAQQQIRDDESKKELRGEPKLISGERIE